MQNIYTNRRGNIKSQQQLLNLSPITMIRLDCMLFLLLLLYIIVPINNNQLQFVDAIIIPKQTKSVDTVISSPIIVHQQRSISRRNTLLSIVSGVTTTVQLPILVDINNHNIQYNHNVNIPMANAATTTTIRPTLVTSSKSIFHAYQVQPDPGEKLNPLLSSLSNESFLNKLSNISSNGGAIWLGEHHNSVPDHNLQVNLLRELYNRRRQHSINDGTTKIAVGLEQVQVQFQPVLDQYNEGIISLEEMRNGVQWDTRWIWPFEGYAPVFQLAKELNMPLIALNVNTEDMTQVEKGGFPGLGRDRLQVYIRDGIGFDEFSRQPQFRTYANYVILPSYQLHKDMGLLQYTMSGEKLPEIMPFKHFLSGRLLWDEAMASNAMEWTRKNPGGIIVGLVGADHVKFQNGIPARFSRLADTQQDCISVILNPTLIDTRPLGTVSNSDAAMSSNRPNQITLQLRYLKDNVNEADRALPESTGGVMPLADYIVIGA